MNHLIAVLLCALLACLACDETRGADEASTAQASRLDAVQITATRFGEQVQEVPLSISVVEGDDLRARGATDLRGALALLGGLTVGTGGDRGPAGAVPGLLGLREIDDLLLLIDGVPAGGVFFPTFEQVSLTNVERIEVLRGTAPVYFGTTAFAGTINVIHYAAGQAGSTVTLRYGSFGSVSLGGSFALADDQFKQSIAGDIDRDRVLDPRGGFNRAQLAYRASAALAGGQAKLDVNLTSLRQKPVSPVPVDASGHLSRALPVDFNQNPSDAKLDTDRAQLGLGYEKALPLGQWGSTLSVTRFTETSIRGFLVDDFVDTTEDDAQGAAQSRRVTDVFFDTHVTSRLASWLMTTAGLNELYGRVTQSSNSFTYSAPLDGGMPASSAAGTTTGSQALHDQRSFFGAYVQTRVLLGPDASLLGGLRWNRTIESRLTSGDAQADFRQDQHNSRLSGSLGGQVKVWSDESGDLDDVTVHVSVGNTFQPPQLDFGADAGFQPLLRPETQQSVVAGVKADGFDGRFDLDLAAFFVDFKNQTVVRRIDAHPVLANGGSERFTGVEVESSARPSKSLTIAAHASYADARYREFTTLIGDTAAQLAGHSLPLTSHLLVGGGVVLAPSRGWQSSVTVNFNGPRYLDMLNTAKVGGYALLDASLGYRFERWSLSVSGGNLLNRRDPMLASELGDSQIYRLPGRQLGVSVSIPVR